MCRGLLGGWNQAVSCCGAGCGRARCAQPGLEKQEAAPELDGAGKGSKKRKLGSAWKEGLVEDTIIRNTNATFSEITVFA